MNIEQQIDKAARKALACIMVIITCLCVIIFDVVIAQDDKVTATTANVKDILKDGSSAKSISLNQQEKQPFIDILNNFDSALKSKQLAEAQMENAQLKLKIAVEEIKKLKGCGDCQFDLQKLELIKPDKKDEKKDEVKKEVKP